LIHLHTIRLENLPAKIKILAGITTAGGNLATPGGHEAVEKI
jgi:hypothetical protein